VPAPVSADPVISPKPKGLVFTAALCNDKIKVKRLAMKDKNVFSAADDMSENFTAIKTILRPLSRGFGAKAGTCQSIKHEQT
jgi:hypothetical protein